MSFRLLHVAGAGIGTQGEKGVGPRLFARLDPLLGETVVDALWGRATVVLDRRYLSFAGGLNPPQSSEYPGAKLSPVVARGSHQYQSVVKQVSPKPTVPIAMPTNM